MDADILRALAVPPLLMGEETPKPNPDLEWAIQRHDELGGRNDTLSQGRVYHRHDWRCEDEIMALYHARRGDR